MTVIYYTSEQLSRMTYDELCNVSVDEMEKAPVRGLGFPPTVLYACKYCSNSLEGSERSVRAKHWIKYDNPVGSIKSVICPYCKEVLWSDDGENRTRLTAYRLGHFDRERKKRFLKDLKVSAKRKLR